jgi:branched-chain amino acid transport system ATP-binding protein
VEDLLLSVDNITAGYGATVVLHGFSLELQAGQAVAVLGANGAGKSTLMKSIAGLRPLRGGAVVFRGEDVSRAPAEQRARMGIALVPEGRGVFGNLTVQENLWLGATALKKRRGAGRADDPKSTVSEIYDMFPILGDRKQQRAGTLSGGQQQMLAIGRALMGSPTVLLLDEPCLGLAPKVGLDVYEILERLRADGQSMIVVEESARRALEFVDRAIVMKGGAKVLERDAADISEDAEFLDAYFGSSSEADTA